MDPSNPVDQLRTRSKNADEEGKWQVWHFVLIGAILFIIICVCGGMMVKSWVKFCCFNPNTGKVGINPAIWTIHTYRGGGGSYRSGGFGGGGGGDFGGGGGGGGGDGGGC